MTAPLGHLLVRNGVLDQRQVRRALEEQSRTGVPFGVACEQLFSVDPRDIEDAWADQYAGLTRTVDLAVEALDSTALGVVERRQAWQFGVFPVRWDGGELMVATTSDLLVRAHRFMSTHRREPVFFVMTSHRGLVEALQRAYPLPGAALPTASRRTGRSAA